MQVCIIGGGGLVGSMAAFAMQCSNVISRLCLVDAHHDLAQGQATDLLHGAALTGDLRVTASDLSEIPNSDLVVITAGLRRKPDESRLDLIDRNVDLFLQLLGQCRTAGWKKNTTLLVVSNPVDILTHLAVQRSGLEPQRVLGLGTQLDTARLRGYISSAIKVPASQVQAIILGEHGDSMVPIWSSATVQGLPLEHWPGWTMALQRSVFESTKTAGATLIKLKGGSGFAVGLSIREVVETILLNQRRLLPVSTMQTGCYGIRDLCLSVPTILGCQGVVQQWEIPLTPKEKLALQQSARVLQQTLDHVHQRVGKSK